MLPSLISINQSWAFHWRPIKMLWWLLRLNEPKTLEISTQGYIHFSWHRICQLFGGFASEVLRIHWSDPSERIWESRQWVVSSSVVQWIVKSRRSGGTRVAYAVIGVIGVSHLLLVSSCEPMVGSQQCFKCFWKRDRLERLKGPNRAKTRPTTVASIAKPLHIRVIEIFEISRMDSINELPKDIAFLCQWTHDFDKLLADKFALKLFAVGFH